MVTIVVSSTFKRAVKHLSAEQKEMLESAVHKILADPSLGKPLKYGRGERSIRMPPFRIIFSFRKDVETLYLLKFEHRDSAYKR
ncbi:MAG: type II toxin-antitoxin system RelE/ParE family toxin [Nanoarchaeota archaeon]